jgi:archaellum component FlaC
MRQEGERMRKNTLVALVILFVLAGAVATFAGCGSDSGDDAQATYESDVDKLKTAVAVMTESGTYESIESFEAAWEDVEKAYDDLVISANVVGKKIENLKDAWGGLVDAIGNITSEQSLQQKVNEIKSALEDLDNAVKAIKTTG